jgi:glycosyltransferase involved in cell wall biosynthesis
MVQPFRRSSIKRLETRLLASFIRLFVKILDLRNLVVVHCDFYSADFVGELNEVLNVYDCVDDHAGFSWANPATRAFEDELSRKSDLVLAVSESLATARKAVARRVVLVPNAAEVERFLSVAPGSGPPADIQSLPSPILGYVGVIYDWIDFELLSRLARAHPEWAMVLIGPIRVPLGPLEGVSNVHILGPRPYDSVPAYIHAFDVALVPFKVNALTERSDFIKVYEYLAAGKPVVGTDLSSLRRFGDVVRIGRDFESFEAAVLESLKDRSPASVRRREDSVRGQEWSSRAAVVERLIAESLA